MSAPGFATAQMVTVVIPTKDRNDLLTDAVASALGQSHPRVQVIVVDDGSQVPVQLPRDERICVLRHDESRGTTAARNAGLAEASGDWVCFLDDDDLLTPDAIAHLLDAACGSELPRPVASLGAVEYLNGAGEARTRREPVTLPAGSAYFLEGSAAGPGSYQVHSTLLAPTEVLRAIGGFDEQLRAWIHDDLFLRLNEVCSLQGIPAVTYQVRDLASQRLTRNMPARADALRLTIEKHRPAFKRYPKQYALFLGTLGVTELRAGRWLPAVAATARALRADPRRLKGWRQFAMSLGGPRLRELLIAVARRSGQ